MHTIIYYFSGTGNSLAVARDIAEKLVGKLIAIPDVMDRESLNPEADVLGIVFPVYHGGMPFIINRFVRKIANLGQKYLFGICTYGDSPGLAVEYLEQAVRAGGGKLAAGFGVHMPYNYLTPPSRLKGFFESYTLREIVPAKQQALFAAWESKLERIAEFVSARQEGTFETGAETIYHLVDRLNLREMLGKPVWLKKIAGFSGPTDLPFRESLQLMDAGFRTDDKCIGCGTCAKVCPTGNIALVAGRPVWQHRCEQCFACLQWCPQAALQFRVQTAKGKRYHHPAVKLSDMLRRRP
jgi:ferredoxin/flavodoxin